MATYVAPAAKRLAVRAARVRSKPMPELPDWLFISAVVGIILGGLLWLIAMALYLTASGDYFYMDGSVDWATVYGLQSACIMWMLGSGAVASASGAYLMRLPRRVWEAIGILYGKSIYAVPAPIVASYEAAIASWIGEMLPTVAKEVRRHLPPTWAVMARYEELIARDAHLARHLRSDSAVLPETRATIADNYAALGVQIAGVQIEALAPVVADAQYNLEVSNAGVAAELPSMTCPKQLRSPAPGANDAG